MAFHEEKLLSVAKDKGCIGVSHPPPNLENFPFQRAKMAVQIIFVGRLTGPRTI